jgi:hypothetical protein
MRALMQGFRHMSSTLTGFVLATSSCHSTHRRGAASVSKCEQVCVRGISHKTGMKQNTRGHVPYLPAQRYWLVGQGGTRACKLVAARERECVCTCICSHERVCDGKSAILRDIREHTRATHILRKLKKLESFLQGLQRDLGDPLSWPRHWAPWLGAKRLTHRRPCTSSPNVRLCRLACL